MRIALPLTIAVSIGGLFFWVLQDKIGRAPAAHGSDGRQGTRIEEINLGERYIDDGPVNIPYEFSNPFSEAARITLEKKSCGCILMQDGAVTCEANRSCRLKLRLFPGWKKRDQFVRVGLRCAGLESGPQASQTLDIRAQWLGDITLSPSVQTLRLQRGRKTVLAETRIHSRRQDRVHFAGVDGTLPRGVRCIEEDSAGLVLRWHIEPVAFDNAKQFHALVRLRVRNQVFRRDAYFRLVSSGSSPIQIETSRVRMGYSRGASASRSILVRSSGSEALPDDFSAALSRVRGTATFQRRGGTSGSVLVVVDRTDEHGGAYEGMLELRAPSVGWSRDLVVSGIFR